MKYLLVLLFALTASAQQEPNSEPRKKVDILVLNRMIAECGPDTIEETENCDPKDLWWTPCLYNKLNITDGFEANTCVTLSDIQELCLRYEDRSQPRACHKRSPILFHLLKLQDDVEKCGPENIAHTCHCDPNQVFWTRCLYDRLQLDPFYSPRPFSCVTLEGLTRLFEFYSNPADLI